MSDTFTHAVLFKRHTELLVSIPALSLVSVNISENLTVRYNLMLIP